MQATGDNTGVRGRSGEPSAETVGGCFRSDRATGLGAWGSAGAVRSTTRGVRLENSRGDAGRERRPRR